MLRHSNLDPVLLLSLCNLSQHDWSDVSSRHFGTNPDARDIQGPTKSIATSADGVLISENLPETARHMHNSAIIKTMVTSQGAHEQASYLMHTSYLKRGTIAHPTFGSWVSKLSGNINTTIPSNVQIGANPTECRFLSQNMVLYPLEIHQQDLQIVKLQITLIRPVLVED